MVGGDHIRILTAAEAGGEQGRILKDRSPLVVVISLSKAAGLESVPESLKPPARPMSVNRDERYCEECCDTSPNSYAIPLHSISSLIDGECSHQDWDRTQRDTAPRRPVGSPPKAARNHQATKAKPSKAKCHRKQMRSDEERRRQGEQA